MRQYTNTYRITITDEMREQLQLLKLKYSIKPTSFIRLAIEEKLQRDLPSLKIKENDVYVPF